MTRTVLIAESAGLIDAASGRRLAGSALGAALAPIRAAYDALPAGIVLARTAPSLGSVLRLVAALTAGRPIALLDPQLSADALAELVARYLPAAVLGLAEPPGSRYPLPDGYRSDDREALGGAWLRERTADLTPHPDLALLLATSGSTGDPRLVRLSRRAVTANAHAIVQALRIDPEEIAPTNLPLHYTYGLSVLTSHLAAGANVLICTGDLLSREFWGAFDEHRATSLAGVPTHYEMLARTRWDPATRPWLRTLTQSGGRLADERIRQLSSRIAVGGGRFFVMYGQTEATARVCVMPPERLADKLGSVGRVIPGGRLLVRDADGCPTTRADVTGEIVYRGPCVMLGYADTAADLARGDDLRGELATGDLGRLDDEGFLTLNGRIKRIGKVFGVRVNLDDVERLAAGDGQVAAVASGERVVVWREGCADVVARDLGRRLADRLGLHRSGIVVLGIDRIPTLVNGKPDYARLEREAIR